MLRSKDIVGLPIFTIAEGKEIGKITEILVNPSRGVVVALAVENTSKIVAFSSVKSIGKDAVVIDSTSQLLDISEHRNIERWKEIKIVDSKVITSLGRYVGQVSDFLLDMMTGKVISCIASDLEGERLVIPASRIVTFGKDALIIVDAEVEEALGEKEKEEVAEMEEVLEAAKEEREEEREETKTVLEQLAEEIEKEPERPSEKPVPETAAEPAKEMPLEEPIPEATSKPAPQEKPPEARVPEAAQDVGMTETAPKPEEPPAPAVGLAEEAAETAPPTETAEKVSESVAPPEESVPKAAEPAVAAKQAEETKEEPVIEPVKEPKVEAEPPSEPKTEEAKTETAQEEATVGEQLAGVSATVKGKAGELKTVPETGVQPPKEQPPEAAQKEIKRPEEQVQAILDRHQHDFLLGKTLKRDLLDDDGTLILKAGETITEEIIEKTKKANKYLELGFYI